MHYRVRYSLDFDLKIRSGQGCFLKGSVISLAKVALGNKTKMFFLVNQDLGQKFTRNAKTFCFVSRCNFSNFYHSTLHEFSYHFNASSIEFTAGRK